MIIVEIKSSIVNLFYALLEIQGNIRPREKDLVLMHLRGRNLVHKRLLHNMIQ